MSGWIDELLSDNKDGLFLSYYGDDFTGSTDVMEGLTLAGIQTALFLRPPSREELAQQFPNIRAVGVAGMARTLSPGMVEERVAPVIVALRDLGATVFHYKICSTFDSSPAIGNIGHAIRMLSDIFHVSALPLVVGNPLLRRYCVFGNLFAGMGDMVARLDRHPTMMKHPVTPMGEADIAVMLAEQAALHTEVVTVLDLGLGVAGSDAALRDALSHQPDVVLFDVLSDSDMAEVGRLLLSLITESKKERASMVIVGSSGVEYALATGLQGGRDEVRHPLYAWPVRPPKRVLVVCGSRSPTTERQIAFALDRGFAGIAIDPGLLSDPMSAATELERVHREATRLMDVEVNVLLHVPTEPDGRSSGSAVEIGRGLGELTARILASSTVSRLIVAGGDTSGWVTSSLGIYAMEMIAPLAPGGPLCRARSSVRGIDGIELALKGGQVGSEEYLVAAALLSD